MRNEMLAAPDLHEGFIVAVVLSERSMVYSLLHVTDRARTDLLWSALAGRFDSMP